MRNLFQIVFQPLIDNDWGVSNYPAVYGHEGIGVVETVGSFVKNFKVGDTVGVAWIRDSCRTCSACLCGRENICEPGYQGTYLGPGSGPWGKQAYNEHGGCFSQTMRVEERFVVAIPDNIPPELAAPMMCGGATVFEPIVDYVTPDKSVAVASIGGLGTLAIKLAAAYGGQVTALSGTASKKDKALAAGAKHFYACLGDKEKMKELAGKFDVILDTNPANADVGDYMNMLKFNGTYCRMGVPPAGNDSFTYNYIPLIFTARKIAGSVVTGTHRMKLMFDLASNNPERFAEDPNDWQVEVVPYDKINECMENLLNGKNKGYRYVLKW